MTSERIWDAIIVGGGPAGCAAAIRLAERGYTALLLERKRYPSPKLCGEFLSVEASGYLDRLGVLDAVSNAGARTIAGLRLIACDGANVRAALPGVALGLSRQALDQTLMNRARQLGAQCRDGARVDAIEGSLPEGFRVHLDGCVESARMVFGAYGKRSALDPVPDRQDRPSPFVAFKAHFRGKHDPETVEVFGFNGGYIGFAPVENGLVNACLIAHRNALNRAGGRADALFDLAATENHALKARLSGLTRCDKTIGCSGISFRIKPKFEHDVCSIGDTAGMIAPLCGDGMSMAMRSAEIAVSCAVEYLAHAVAGREFKKNYTAAWNREFRTRMLLGRAAQAIAFSPLMSHAMVRLCHAAPGVKDMLIRATRGKPSHAPPTRGLASDP